MNILISYLLFYSFVPFSRKDESATLPIDPLLKDIGSSTVNVGEKSRRSYVEEKNQKMKKKKSSHGEAYNEKLNMKLQVKSKRKNRLQRMKNVY